MSTNPSHPRPDVPPLATASPRSQPDTLGRGIFLRKQVREDGARLQAAFPRAVTAPGIRHAGTHCPLLSSPSQQRSGDTQAGVRQGRSLRGLELGCSNAQPYPNCGTSICTKQRWGSGQLGSSPDHSTN